MSIWRATQISVRRASQQMRQRFSASPLAGKSLPNITQVRQWITSAPLGGRTLPDAAQIRQWLTLTPLARKSLSDVTRRKGRTLLVVLGILVGVAGLTAINVSSDAFYNAFAYSASETPTPDLELNVQNVKATTLATVKSAANVKVAQLTYNYTTRWTVAATPGHVNMRISGYDNVAQFALFPIQITSGKAPGAGEVLMEIGDRTLQNFALGSMVTVDGPTGPVSLRVVGTARALGKESPAFTSTARAYMSATALQQLSGGGATTELDVQVNQKSQERATLASLTKLLTSQGVTVSSATTNDDYWDPSPVNGFYTILRVLSVIALLLTSFLIINTVTTLVTEQTKIIGTMKAAGATSGVVLRSYLTSVTIYGLAGTVLGAILGVYGGYQLTAFLATLITLDLGPFTLSPWILAMSLAVGLGVPLLAALLPLWSGTRITVRDAMAAYGVSAGTAQTHVKLARRLPWVPQTIWLGLRGLFRKRGRAILTLLALTLSGTAFLSIQTTTYSVNVFLKQVYAAYDFDASVNVKRQPTAQIEAKLLAIPNVARVERFEQTEIDTTWGTALLTGVEQNAQLYHHDLLAGRWLAPGDKNVLVISDTLANATGKHVGDSFTFGNQGAGASATWKIVGEVHDLDSGLGLKGAVFTSVASLHGFEGVSPDLAGSIIIQAKDRSQPAVNKMADALDATLSAAGLTPTVTTEQQQVSRNQNQFQILYVLLYAVAAIVALVGILGLFNTLTTSVLERRREIGILRSMGATGARVASVFWVEGLSLASISWLVASLLGLPAAYAFVSLISNVLLPLPFAFSPVSLVVTLFFILLCATLASLIPAWSAARMRIADTLRYE